MTIKAKKAVSTATGEEAEAILIEFNNCPNGMFWLMRGLAIDSDESVCGRCVR